MVHTNALPQFAKEIILDEKQLRIRCEYWQEILFMQEWTIQIRLLKGSNAALRGPSGRCITNWNHRSADIVIERVEDYKEWDTIALYDAELILLHEILHIKWNQVTDAMRKHDKSDALDEDMEWAIESCAKAMLILDRKTKRKIK